MDRIRIKVRAHSTMDAFWKTGSHDVGYDGCGAHTHKGGIIANVDTALRVEKVKTSFLENAVVEVRASFVDPSRGFNKPMYYIVLRSGNEVAHTRLAGEDVKKAISEAGEVLKEVKKVAKERGVTMLRPEVEYNPDWLLDP